MTALCLVVPIPTFGFGKDVRRDKRRRVFQPKACGLCFGMAVMERLDDLVRLANPAADYADGVFNANAWDWQVHQILNKRKRCCLLWLLVLEIPRSADRKVCAWRVTDCKIELLPVFKGKREDIYLHMWAGAF